MVQSSLACLWPPSTRTRPRSKSTRCRYDSRTKGPLRINWHKSRPSSLKPKNCTSYKHNRKTQRSLTSSNYESTEWSKSILLTQLNRRQLWSRLRRMNMISSMSIFHTQWIKTRNSRKKKSKIAPIMRWPSEKAAKKTCASQVVIKRHTWPLILGKTWNKSKASRCICKMMKPTFRSRTSEKMW